MAEWPPYAQGYPGDFDLIDYPGEVWDFGPDLPHENDHAEED